MRWGGDTKEEKDKEGGGNGGGVGTKERILWRNSARMNLAGITANMPRKMQFALHNS